MRVLMINIVCGIRSTGRICTDIATALEAQGHEVKIAYGRENVPEQFQKYAVKIGTDLDIKIAGVEARIFDNVGFSDKRATEKFIDWVRKYDPDVIHLHNLHGYYINVEVLFNYLKTCGKKIIWTLHDCWSFTGHCTYFDFAHCDKWKTKCHHCPQKKEYPASYLLSRADHNFEKKKELFTDIPNLEFVTPSKWIAGLVKQSYLNHYPVTVINNGINTENFNPKRSEHRANYGIGDSFLVLGVAAIWNRRKGLKYLVQLSKETDFKVAVIGVTEKQKSSLPDNMIGILRTNSVDELADWYSASDVFVNPTLEENYPTTNLEAISCGTPVITFNTGGSPESAAIFGYTVNNYDEMKVCLQQMSTGEIIPKKKPYDFSIKAMIDQYLKMY